MATHEIPTNANQAEPEDGFAEALLSRGIASDLASRIASMFGGWSELKNAVAAPTGADGISTDELEKLRKAMERREIPRPTVRRLIRECEFRCCLCWNLDADCGVVIHHIRPHEAAPDDTYDNLVVLCTDHHSRVHTSWELARHPFPADLLRQRKAAFIAAIADFRAGQRPAPGRETRVQAHASAAPPIPPCNFVGRLKLAECVSKGLFGARQRVALVGMGGAGKTALALHTIEALRPGFPAGVFWFEAGTGALVVQSLLSALVRFLGSDPADLAVEEQMALARELLKKRTVSGAVLVALDNIQADSLDSLTPFLSRLPAGTSLLLTCREIAVAASLDAEPVHVEAMERTESLRLLSLVSGSPLTTAGARDTDRLLDLLGDLSLAVELIGRQIAIRTDKPGFDLATLCDRLEQFNATLLSFPGHRGVAASFALSYDALDAAERNIFRSCGEFADGPLSLNDVVSVTVGTRSATEAVMDSLVSASLLSWGNGPDDYRIHPLLKKYAAFQLDQIPPEERIELQKRYVGHFTTLLAETTRYDEANFAAIDPMFDNVCRAIRIAAKLKLDASVSELVQQLSASTRYFQFRNLASESVPLLELAIVAARNLGEPDAVAAHTANLGNAYQRMGRPRDAFRHYEASIAIVRKTGNDHDLASNLQNLGATMLAEGHDPARAERILHEAFEAAVRSQNSDALIGTLNTLGNMCRQVGRLKEARKFYSDALTAARLAKVRLAEGNNLSNLGLVEDALGRKPEAERMIREALQIAREIGDLVGEGNRTGHLAGFMASRAKTLPPGPERYCLLEDARRLLSEALQFAHKTRDAEKAACWLMNLGTTWMQSGDYCRAQTCLSEALKVSVEAGYAQVEAQVRLNLGSLHACCGRSRDALRELKESEKLLRRLRSPMAEVAASRAAQIHFALKERDGPK